MKVSGFTFLRNANILGYPFIESIKSILPLCDEFVVNIGESEDDTLEMVKGIGSPKIRIIQSQWNENMQIKGFVYGQQKTVAHYNCTGDWAFYLEADEVVHEDDIQKIYDTMKRHLNNPKVEALIFDYIHFYGDPWTYIDSPHWYRKAPRIIRNTLRTYSPDGLFFVVLKSNKKGRYPYSCLTGAKMYHYGWVRTEDEMNEKSRRVNKYWGKEPYAISYKDIDPTILRRFKGTHPLVMKEWLLGAQKDFKPSRDYKPSLRDRKERLKKKIEDIFHIDLSKKHFRLAE